ncbi:MAG TPA: S1 RNA-binding domain-containing protein [Treponemataceae bacterium]|nr:S1 RNA-binding domain-containing protein [Treponemataceae bacterium]
MKSQKPENMFAALYEKSLSKMESLQPGEQLQTEIVSISNDCVFVDLSGKSEGVLDKNEFVDKEGNLTVTEGDSVKVFFLEAKNGEMHFTTRISGHKADSFVLENAYQAKIPVEGVVENEVKGGYEVKIGRISAFCPFSQLGFKRSKQTDSSPIGKHLSFQIIEYKENGRKIIVSNRKIEEAAYNDNVQELKTTLKENMLVNGIVTSIEKFGAFVDIKGVQALLPISEISRERIEAVGSVLEVGETIEAKILNLDWKNERISISMKSLLSDPWQSAIKKYPKNSKHTGTVVKLTNYGAFVSLEPGLDGLIHISELKSDSVYNTYTNPKSALKKGESIVVQIVDIDATNKRIALKPTSSKEQDKTTQKYLDTDSRSDTYNPFEALLKK